MADEGDACLGAAEPCCRATATISRAGAEEIAFRGGKLLRMKGLEQVAAGCVALPDGAIADPVGFIAEASRCAAASGALLLRFYTPETDDLPAFVSAGLRRSVEQGFVAATSAGLSSGGSPAARILPVRDEQAWDRKLSIAATLEQLPDGKQAAAADWTELERRKCEGGYMEAFLIEVDGETCGAFALANCVPVADQNWSSVQTRAARRSSGVGYALDRLAGPDSNGLAPSLCRGAAATRFTKAAALPP